MVAEPGRDAIGPTAAQDGQSPTTGGTRRLEVCLGRVRDQRGVHHAPRDAAREQLGAEPLRTKTARRPALDPVACKRAVVEVPAPGEIVDDRVRDVGGCATADETTAQLGGRPGAAGQQIGGGQPRPFLVERGPGGARTRYGFFMKGLVDVAFGAGVFF